MMSAQLKGEPYRSKNDIAAPWSTGVTDGFLYSDKKKENLVE